MHKAMLSSQELWNLLTPTPSTPPRHDAHGASHRKPMESPGDGSHLTRKRPQSNDDQLPTLCANVQLNLIFNDGGTYHPTYHDIGPEHQRNDDTIHDTRPPMDKTEARELARTLKADIIVNVEANDPTGLKWNIETREDGPWTYTTPMQSRVLAGINKAVTTTLHCRTKPGVTQDVHLILVRIIKGKSRLTHFDAEMRQTVMFTLFDMLLQAAQPAVMIGNVGMSLISIVMYAKEYEHRTGARLTDQIQLLPNTDQELICISLATRERSRTVVQVDAELCPPRMFVVNLVDESATYTDGSTEQLAPKRADHERKKLKLTVTALTAQSMATQPTEWRMANDGFPYPKWKFMKYYRDEEYQCHWDTATPTTPAARSADVLQLAGSAAAAPLSDTPQQGNQPADDPNSDISLAIREHSRTVTQVDAELCPPRMFAANLIDEAMTYTDGSTEQLAPNRVDHERKKPRLMMTSLAAQSMAAQPEERRMTNDGSPYSKCEFMKYYGAEEYQYRWDTATPTTPAARSSDVIQFAVAAAAAPLIDSPQQGNQPADDLVTWKYTSDGAHLAGNSGPQRATAKPRTQMYIELMSHLTLLSEREYKWQPARTKWPLHLHLHPVAQKSQRSDGTHVFGPVDMQATLQRLDGALKITEEARKQSGITNYNETLTNQQRATAHHWLQYQCFEKEFMLNPALSQMVIQFEANPDSCKGPQLRILKEKRRGAFKAWKQKLLGNTPLFHTILTSGIIETGDMRCFLLRYVQEIQKKQAPINAHLLEELRMTAITARQILKDAKEFQVLIKQYQDEDIDGLHMTRDVFLLERMTTQVGSERAQKCVEYTMQLLRQLETGKLQNDCRAADACHRGGQDWIATRITLKDAAMFQSSISQMEEFKGQ